MRTWVRISSLSMEQGARSRLEVEFGLDLELETAPRSVLMLSYGFFFVVGGAGVGAGGVVGACCAPGIGTCDG